LQMRFSQPQANGYAKCPLPGNLDKNDYLIVEIFF
jgi:hypothetical protein